MAGDKGLKIPTVLVRIQLSARRHMRPLKTKSVNQEKCKEELIQELSLANHQRSSAEYALKLERNRAEKAESELELIKAKLLQTEKLMMDSMITLARYARYGG